MGDRLTRTKIRARLSTLAAFLILVCSVSAAAQEVEEDSVPPPPKSIPKEVKAQLEAQTDVKKRTKLALELMDARLTLAEQLYARQDYDAMFLQLGTFHALIDDSLEFLTRNEKDSKKVIYNFKRLEMGLRSFPHRLNIIRREMPARYEFYVRYLLRYIRDARAKAIEPLFGDSVVPDGDEKEQ